MMLGFVFLKLLNLSHVLVIFFETDIKEIA